MSQVSQCNSDTHFLGLGEDYITYIYIHYITLFTYVYIYIYRSAYRFGRVA